MSNTNRLLFFLFYTLSKKFKFNSHALEFPVTSRFAGLGLELDFN